MRRGTLLVVIAALVAAVGPGARAAPGGRVERVEHPAADDLPSLGPSVAPVTIEFFANLGDGFGTGQLHGLLRQLARRHPGRLRVVYRLVGSWQVVNEHILAGLEAHAQGHFVELVDRMYAASNRSPRVGDLAALGEAVGLDRARLVAAMDVQRPSSALTARLAAVRANHLRRRRHQVKNVPGLMVNGRSIDQRVTSLDELEDIYDQAYGEAMARLADGVALEGLYDVLLAERTRMLPEPAAGLPALDGFDLDDPPAPRPTLIHVDRRRGDALGDDDAPVTLTFFCNLVTRPCAQAASSLDELRALYPERVRLVFRHLVDPSDETQEHATRYAIAARCAARAGRFEDLYDRFLVHRSGPSTLDDAGLIALAVELGLDGRRFGRCLRDPRAARAIAREGSAARQEGVRRTPALVIGGRLYLGSRSFDELAWRVERQLGPGILGELADDEDAAALPSLDP